jgi:hypothetical protein
MLLYQLENILEISLEGVPLVVDNAYGPSHAVSLQKNRRQNIQKRSVSLGSGKLMVNRWSSTPSDEATNSPSSPRRPSRSTLCRVSPSRSRSFDDILEETVSSTPLRVPVRHRSPPPPSPMSPSESSDRERPSLSSRFHMSSPVHRRGFIHKERQDYSPKNKEPENPAAMGSSSSSNPLRIPTRRDTFIHKEQRDYSPKNMKPENSAAMDSSSNPLRIPTGRDSPTTVYNSGNLVQRIPQEVSSDIEKNITTTDLLNKALEEVEGIDQR